MAGQWFWNTDIENEQPGKPIFTLEISDRDRPGNPLFLPYEQDRSPAPPPSGDIIWAKVGNYLWCEPVFVADDEDPPGGGGGPPRIEKTATVGDWVAFAEGDQSQYLCQDPNYHHPFQLLVYEVAQGAGDPPPIISLIPPLGQNYTGFVQILGTPVPFCQGGVQAPYPCSVGTVISNYSYLVAIYEFHFGFPLGYHQLVYFGPASGLVGSFGVRAETGGQCRCWRRSITVTETAYDANGNIMWTTTRQYTQYFNSTSLQTGPPNPNYPTSGNHCTINYQPPANFPLPPNFPQGF